MAPASFASTATTTTSTASARKSPIASDRIRRLRLHPRRSRARQDPEYRRLWRPHRSHQRQLRPRQPPLRANRRSLQIGFDACVFIPADLEPAKILNTAVYGARIVRINGNYDHVNRLCAQIADRFHWGLVNVNLRPYYAEGSKTHGFEIAEQLGWRLPDNVVVPMAGGSLIGKIAKAFRELVALGWVEDKPVKFFGAQATGCSPISDAVKRNLPRFEPQKPATIARSLAIGNPADGPYAIKLIRETGGWAEDVSDAEIVAAIKLLAETEGIFAETAGGVTAGVAQKLVAQNRIKADEVTVVCITGNGLKTTDAIAAEFPQTEAIAPRLDAFEAYLDAQLRQAEPVSAGAGA